MSGLFSAAPAWSESTLQWIRENHPVYLGARGTLDNKLKAALFKAGYMLDVAKHDIKRQDKLLGGLISRWDANKHAAFVKWVAAGGYKAPPAAATPALPTVAVASSDGSTETLEITLEMPKGDEKPKGRVQNLEDVVAAVEFDGDDRYGAW